MTKPKIDWSVIRDAIALNIIIWSGIGLFLGLVWLVLEGLGV